MSEYKDIFQANTDQSEHVILVAQNQRPTWHRAEAKFSAEPLADIQAMFGEHRYVQADLSATWADEEGVYSHRIEGERSVLRVHRTTGEVQEVKTHGKDYVIHDPAEWFLPVLEDMEVSRHEYGTDYRSALRLGVGDYFAVSLQFPEITTSGLVEVSTRNTLSVMTSLAGKVGTSVSKSETVCICDNTTKASEMEAIFSVRHTKNSGDKRMDFLSVIETYARTGAAYAVSAELQALVQAECTIDQLTAIINTYIPAVEGSVETQGGRNQKTRRLRQQNELWEMVTQDEKVSPFIGTAFGAYQLLSTWEHYASPLRGTERGVRNMRQALTGSATHAKAYACVAKAIGTEKLLALV